MRLFTLLVGSILLSSAVWVGAQDTAAPTNQLPGVSIRFLGFTDMGPPQTMTVTLSPVTNQTIFGPRSTFAGPTNTLLSTPGGPAAIFQFSNASPEATACTVLSLEYKTPTGWKAAPLTSGSIAVLVPAKSAVTRTIPVTSTNLQWRATAFCVEQATGISRMIERGKELGNEVLTGVKPEHFSGRKYMTTNSESAK